jgi:hypothetical protein
VRHADAGYEVARRIADGAFTERGCRVPMR